MFKMLTQENEDLLRKLKDYERIANEEMAVKDAVRTLEDEINHIKQHYEIQMSEIRSENECLKKYNAEQQHSRPEHKRTRSKDRHERRNEYSPTENRPRKSKSREPRSPNLRRGVEQYVSPGKDQSILLALSS